MLGVLNINKPKGFTSHDVVACIRRHLKGEKAGHTGTLDPFATGVLPLCIGQATRIAQFISSDTKTYRALVQLGIETDTLDLTGNIVRESGFNHISKADVEASLKKFTGTINQVPPMYSALKQNGQPLYKLARKGITVDRPAREVQIYSLKLLSFNLPFFEIEIECSSGTYIRTLADDLGKDLQSGAALSELIRTKSGQFSIENSLNLDEAEILAREGKLASRMLGVNQVLAHFPEFVIDNEAVKLIKNGVNIKASMIKNFPSGDFSAGSCCRILSSEMELVSLGKILISFNSNVCPDRSEPLLHPEIVFN